MTREDLITLFQHRQEYWAARDSESLVLAYAEACVVVSPIFGTVTGRDAIATSYRQLFVSFSDWMYRGVDLVIEPGDNARVAQFFRVEATHTQDMFGVPATHRRFDIQGAILFEFDAAGLIVKERRLYDFSAMLLQLGVLRARPQ
jgi:steroid delta-isomerase-like uncharacterized protein